MMQKTETLPVQKAFSGWIGVSLMAVSFIALYLINFIVPLAYSSYTTRIRDWTKLALAAGALCHTACCTCPTCFSPTR